MKHGFYSVAMKVLPAMAAGTLLAGCSHMPLLDPKGPVGLDERFLIIAAVVLMLIVVIPVVVMVLWFPGKYRATNEKADYAPRWSHSARIEWTVWLIPAVIVTVLSILVWRYTYRLDPYKPIESEHDAIPIEVVSLDWKWLFIYPDQQIATVNKLVFPADVPLSFRITSATVMTSFFIPRLGSQIYAMGGMQTRLNLLAHEEGTFRGQNQQFSGSGYADMKFEAEAVSQEAFDAWVRSVRGSSLRLDAAQYKELEKKSHGYPVTQFSWVMPDLFDRIVRQVRLSGSSASRMPDRDPGLTAVVEER